MLLPLLSCHFHFYEISFSMCSYAICVSFTISESLVGSILKVTVCFILIHSVPVSFSNYICFFLIEGQLLCNSVLFSAKHQHESAIGKPMSPPSWTTLQPPSPSHPFRSLQSPGLSSLSHTANSHWLSVLYSVVYMFLCASFHSSHLCFLPAARVHESVLCVCRETCFK